MKSRALRWLWAIGPVVAYALGIFLLSAQTSLPHVGLLAKLQLFYQQTALSHVVPFDKIEHFSEYTIFGFLIARAISLLGPKDMPRRRVLLLTILVGAAFGGTDEIHQYFVPHRDSDLRDLVADTLGSLTGAGLWLLAENLVRRTLRRPAAAVARAGAEESEERPS